MLKKTLKSNYFLPSSFLQPQNLLFLNTPESEFYTYLQEAHRLVCREPVILEMIESDLDSLSKEKKRFRLLDKKWELSQSGQLPNIDITLFDGEIKADDFFRPLGARQ